MKLSDIPPAVWAQIILLLIVPIFKGAWVRLQSSINTDFIIDTTWSKSSKNILDALEKTPEGSFANKTALNAISQHLIQSSTNGIYKSARPQSSLPDWLSVIGFGIFTAIAGISLSHPINIVVALILTAIALAYEVSALLNSELNRNFRKFIRFSLVHEQSSKVLIENPEIAYIIFKREARRSAYRTYPWITRNYSKCPWLWKIIKRTIIFFNKRFIFEVPETRYGVILKYINIRQREIYKNF